MAVNIANALLPHVEGSHLCCTRQEGMLKEQLKSGVGYLFLNKKSSFDIKALNKLRTYIKTHNITIVHAHSTSFFLAGMLKLSILKIKLIWHDHYGESEYLDKREFKILRKFSILFSGVISVNNELKNWAQENLKCNYIVEFKNFILEAAPSSTKGLQLEGSESDFKIICVANLRPQKDHLNLIRAFENLHLNQGVSLHLVGEDPGTSYSQEVLNSIKKSPVKNRIYYYGVQGNILALLQQADLGVLASRSEGLPVILLEYGMAGLPVVVTDVGKCRNLVDGAGKIVPPKDFNSLSIALQIYIQDEILLKKDAVIFQKNVRENYSSRSAIINILAFYSFLYNENELS